MIERLENNANDVVAANVELNYYLEINPLLEPTVEPEALASENLRLEDWKNVVVRSIESPPQDRVPYSNYFNPIQGSIICSNNDKSQDRNDPDERLQWSEVMFQVYQKMTKDSLQSTKELGTIWRSWVVNSSTLYILAEAQWFGTDEGPPRDMGSYDEYRTGDRGFFAILGSPNGSGVVRMLSDHCNAFRKTIISVRVLNPIPPPMHPTFYFVLADYPLVSALPTKRGKNTISTAGQRRKRQKLSASSLS